MTERPIIMRDDEVRAILAGTKTQVRRVIGLPSLRPTTTPGDHLWVRECYALIWPDGYGPPEDARECSVEYRADGPATRAPGEWPHERRRDPDAPRWRSAASMPRWASRLLLEVASVRVERVQSISDDDVRAEGVPPDPWAWCVSFRAVTP